MPLPEISRDRFDAVLFDLDGVLTSTAAIHAEAWKRMFDAYLASQEKGAGPHFHFFDIETDYKKYVDGKPRYEGVKSFLASRAIKLPHGDPNDPPGDTTVCALGNRKDAMVKQAIDEGRVQSFGSSIRWVRQLKQQGFKLAVVSSSRNCGPVLRAANIEHLFDTRVDGETLIELNLPGKPAPDSFLKAAEILGTTPSRSIVVEDAIPGVEAGAAGKFAMIIGVDREGHGQALRQHGASVVVRDLSEFVNAEVRTQNAERNQ
ncbi:MAG: beta-phosphoglucomutase family hydrolase [Chthoniobacterales bacterium]|nr:beta-phosphoglucomutase family hydrolase [Chthoniobacterales bacterium]